LGDQVEAEDLVLTHTQSEETFPGLVLDEFGAPRDLFTQTKHKGTPKVRRRKSKSFFFSGSRLVFRDCAGDDFRMVIH
jgi:hypothetical protein